MAAKNTRWIGKVKTDSTEPPPGLFTKRASIIARTLASGKVSPKGPESGMRMLNYFINSRRARPLRFTPRRTGKSKIAAIEAPTSTHPFVE